MWKMLVVLLESSLYATCDWLGRLQPPSDTRADADALASPDGPVWPALARAERIVTRRAS